MNIGIYIYDDAEVLDFSGPFEVFTTASRLYKESTAFDVYLIGETGDIVTARAGYKVIPHCGIENHPPLDVLIVVGGVHTQEMTKPNVLRWLRAQAETAKIVASVCTGAFLLAQAGVLENQKVTTHWEDIAGLRIQFPQLHVIEGVRWVDEGDRLTSGGISAGIDMCLHLVGRLHSQKLAEKTALQMEFSWTKNS